jgi:hypothetical protein
MLYLKYKFYYVYYSLLIFFFFSLKNFQDELVWGAAWLLRATKDVSYLNFLKSVGDNDATDTFSWDSKLPGALVLLSRVKDPMYYEKLRPRLVRRIDP